MKRILALLLVLLMVCTIPATVFADYTSTSYYSGGYRISDWAYDMQASYGYPIWYEAPQRSVTRAEAFLFPLRAIQHSLDRQGYSRLGTGYLRPPFTDYNTVDPYIQSEVNVLYANNILEGCTDNTMQFGRNLTRAEMAAIYCRFNRIFLNMGVGYNDYNYGYNYNYNYNYNNYGSYGNYYNFIDTVGHWAQQDIQTAASNGVLQGVGNGYFNPEGTLTIEQIWKIFDSCVGYQGLSRGDIAYALEATFNVEFPEDIDDEYIVSSGERIKRISASSTTLTIDEGQSKRVDITISPSDAAYQKLSWVSEDNRYVTVEKNYNISDGKAYIYVYGKKPTNGYITLTGRTLDGSNKTVEINVKVREDDDYYDDDDGYITSLTEEESTIYLTKGKSTQTKVRIKPSDAYDKELLWTSKDDSIAYPINDYTSGSYSYATIKAVRTGTTYIYAKAQDGSGEKATIKVVVQSGSSYDDDDITSVSASPSKVNIDEGESEKVYIDVYPTEYDNNDITWQSDDEDIAYVDNTTSSYIKIIAVGEGSTKIRGISTISGEEVCVIPVTIGDGNGTSSGDGNTPPKVTLEGATSVNVGENVEITAKVSDDNDLKSFKIDVNDIIGMTGSLSPVQIKKVSDTEYRITLMGVEVASQCICIAEGVAVDYSGNVSHESNEIVIFVKSGE